MTLIKLDANMLRQLQLIELELLLEVKRICQKCDIHYSIIAGTMLGAVRHGGFIPWDDDADIALLRPEYEKFRLACQTELDTERFYFQDHRNTPGYRWGYGKLRRKNTIFLRENQEHMPYQQGVFIDIFPLDQVPENKFLRTIANFHYFCIRKIMWSPVGMLAAKAPFKRKWFKFLYNFFGDRVFAHYDKLIAKAAQKSSKWVRILTFPTPNKEYAYLKEWYQSSVPIEFEGHIFAGIADYDAYLSFKFGDYMSLPPEKDRKVHPVTQIKLLD